MVSDRRQSGLSLFATGCSIIGEGTAALLKSWLVRAYNAGSDFRESPETVLRLARK
jgi:hypothetical protein